MGLYRYGFNGKENDNEVKGDGNQQDYGFRIYDPRAGRFLSVDPLAKSYPELTPYQFGSNRPIDGIDLDGLEYSPAGKGNGVGVPRDNTAVQLYPIHPGNLDKQIAEAPLREKFKQLRNHALGTKSDASVGATPNLGYYGNKLHEERSAELFKQAGWNADGSEPAWHKLANNKTFSNFSRNIGIPITEMAIGEGVVKFVFKGVPMLRNAGKGISEAPAVGDDIALGLGDDLFDFAQQKGFKTYRDFSTGFQKEVIQSTIENGNNRLHFNLTGFSKYRYSKFNPNGPIGIGNITNWELHTIYNTSGALERTTFHKLIDGVYQTVPKPF